MSREWDVDVWCTCLGMTWGTTECLGRGRASVSLYHVELIYHVGFTYLHYQVGITRNKRAQIQADLPDLCVLSKTECETGQCQEGNTWSKHRLSILPGSAMSQKVKTSSMKHQQYSRMATLQDLIERALQRKSWNQHNSTQWISQGGYKVLHCTVWQCGICASREALAKNTSAVGTTSR